MTTVAETKLTPTDIKPEVLAILQKANNWLSAYQILNRLSVCDELIAQWGMPGTGGGNSYTAANAVAQAVQMLQKETGYQTPLYLEGRGIYFEVRGDLVKPGVCALYRIMPKE
jgi:hypothetical protein